jgi:hypothetical protein
MYNIWIVLIRISRFIKEVEGVMRIVVRRRKKERRIKRRK